MIEMTKRETNSHLIKNLRTARKAGKLRAVKDVSGPWILDEQSIRNPKVNFFSIETVSESGETNQLKVRQEDGAEVILLMRMRANGERQFLLQERAEPGLIGRAVYTSTIQSTWQNLRADHDGVKPALHRFASESIDSSRTIYDSIQPDWADLYLSKLKRYRIIEVFDVIEDSPLHLWVTEKELSSLARIPHALSIDLMACIGLFLVQDSMNENRRASSTLGIRPLISAMSALCIRPWRVSRFTSVLSDERGRKVVMVAFSSSSREVREWDQPLLWIPGIRNIRVHAYPTHGLQILDFVDNPHQEAPIEPAHQYLKKSFKLKVGCRSCTKWSLFASGEGGRFLWHDVRLDLIVHDHKPSQWEISGTSFQMDRRELLGKQELSVSLRLGMFGLWAWQNANS